MSFYRITRFASADMSGTKAMAESMRSQLENLGAEFIDVVDYGNGKGVVVAKYPDQATMDAAGDTAKAAFGKMVEAGVIDGDSIHPHEGEVMQSF